MLPVTGEPVHTPAGRRVGHKPVDVLSQDQHRQDLAHPVDEVLPQKPGAVVLKQSEQSPVTDRTNDHVISVRYYRSLGKHFPKQTPLTLSPLGKAVDLLSCQASRADTVRVTGFMGSKYLMLDRIERQVPTDAESFLDAFSGGANVAYHFKRKGFAVIVNDLLRFRARGSTRTGA